MAVSLACMCCVVCEEFTTPDVLEKAGWRVDTDGTNFKWNRRIKSDIHNNVVISQSESTQTAGQLLRP